MLERTVKIMAIPCYLYALDRFFAKKNQKSAGRSAKLHGIWQVSIFILPIIGPFRTLKVQILKNVMKWNSKEIVSFIWHQINVNVGLDL